MAIDTDFIQREATQLVIDDPAGQGFGGLLKETGRGTAEDQKTGRRPSPVCQHSQRLEKSREPLDLVDDDEPLQIPQGQMGILQSGQVLSLLQIEVRAGTLAFSGKFTGQGCLSYLPRTDNPDHLMAGKQSS
jgi:hypothetical protein